jgi:hypothetical protein
LKEEGACELKLYSSSSNQVRNVSPHKISLHKLSPVTNWQDKYHAGNQALSSKEMNGQMRPIQNQGYFQGILPDPELYDPEML